MTDDFKIIFCGSNYRSRRSYDGKTAAFTTETVKFIFNDIELL